MSGDPKSAWGPGQMDDGSISIFTPEEAVKLQGERDAYESAFDATDDEGAVPVDLDSLSVEELDQIIEGLGDDG